MVGWSINSRSTPGRSIDDWLNDNNYNGPRPLNTTEQHEHFLKSIIDMAFVATKEKKD